MAVHRSDEPMIRGLLRILLDIPHARIERKAAELHVRETYNADTAAWREALSTRPDFTTDGTRSS